MNNFEWFHGGMLAPQTSYTSDAAHDYCERGMATISFVCLHPHEESEMPVKLFLGEFYLCTCEIVQGQYH